MPLETIWLIDPSTTGIAAGDTETETDLTTPPHAAETFTGVRTDTVAAVELKLADVEPPGMVTLAGTGRDSDEEVMFTLALGAVALVRVTVQLTFAPDAIDEGLHAMLERAGMVAEPTLTAPPEVARRAASPAADAPRAPFTPTPTEAPLSRLDARLTVTTATTPSGMAFVLIPHARQVYWPAAAEQFSDLPAPANTGPSVTCREAI